MGSDTRDVVVVGGGVMGLSIAYHLGQSGVRALLLERAHLGAGSTSKSGAIIRQHYSHPLTAAMARDSLRTYAAFEDVVGGSAGFVRCGMTLIAEAGDSAGFERNLEMQRGLGIRTERLDAEQLREVVPGVAIDGVVVACLEPDAGYADPLKTLRALAEAVRRQGGEIREGAEVTGFAERDGRVTGVRTAAGEIGAGRVVVAAGAWASRLMAAVGWQARVQPMRVQSAVFRRPIDLAAGPVLIDFPNQMYAKHGSETHVGSISPSEARPADPDDYDEGVDGAYVAMAHDRLSRRLPAMREAVRFGGYGALYAVTPDWLPVVGPAGSDGLYLCAGFSGHGFKLAPAIGATVAAEILGETPAYDFEPLRPQRFARGASFAGRYSYSIMG